MSRKLLFTAAAVMAVAASPAMALSFGHKPSAPAATPARGGPAAAKPAAPVGPQPATPEQRAQAERLDPLARAAFWSNQVRINPSDTVAGVKLATALRQLGQYEEAGQTAQQVLVIAPNDFGALVESARASLGAGNGFYAIAPLKTAAGLQPRDWQVQSLLGVAYDQVSRSADAEAAWRLALELSPDNPAVLSNMAMHAASGGNLPRAEQLLRTAAGRPGATIQERQNLALVLGLQGKMAEAEEITRQNLPPDQAETNLAYLRAAYAGQGANRSWTDLKAQQGGG